MGAQYTDSQKKATIKYLKDKTDSIQIRVPKGKKEKARKFAESNGESLNAFINRLISEAMGESDTSAS